MVEVALVLLAPLLLVALCVLELLLRPPAVGVALAGRVLARGPGSAGGEETEDDEWNGDGDEDDDREHARSLRASERGPL
jgi:hypothetical protein